MVLSLAPAHNCLLPLTFYMPEVQNSFSEQKSKLNKFQNAVRKLGWPFLNSFNKERHEKDFLKAYLKKFDSDEVEVLRKVYKELSARNPGPGIDKATFLQYFPLPGLWGERLFQRFDYKGLGFVDYEELLVGLAVCCRGTKCEIIQVLFQVFDLNNDGLLQKEELVIMLSNLPNLERYVNIGKLKIPTRISEESPRSLPLYPTLEGFSESKEVHYDINAALERLSKFPDDLGDDQFTVSVNPDYEDGFEGEIDSVYDSLDCSYDSSCSFDLTTTENCLCRQNTYERLNENKLIDINNLSHESSFNAPCFSSDTENKKTDKKNEEPAKYVTKSSLITSKHTMNCALSTSSFVNANLDASNNNTADTPDKINISINGVTMTHPLDSLKVSESVNTNEEPTNIDVEAIVDKVLEECENCENDSLTFMEFKTWIEKNNKILAMFNECLHEEAWGLQGNALYRKRNPALFRISQNIANRNERIRKGTLISSNNITKESTCNKINSQNSNLIIQPDTFYKVKRLFTVPANYRNNILNNLISNYDQNTSDVDASFKFYNLSGGNLIAETPVNKSYDLIQEDAFENRSKSASKSSSKTLSSNITNEVEKKLFRSISKESDHYNDCVDVYTKQTREDLKLQLLDIITTTNPDVDIDRLFSQSSNPRNSATELICCPACESLLVVCPRCNKKSLNLVLHEGRVLIECKICLDNIVTQYTVCWHCSWDFSLVANYVDKYEPIYEGVLFKIGKHTRRWRKRYFILVDNLLYYYNHKDDSKPQGFIFLEGCFVKPILNSKQSAEASNNNSSNINLSYCSNVNNINSANVSISSSHSANNNSYKGINSSVNKVIPKHHTCNSTASMFPPYSITTATTTTTTTESKTPNVIRTLAGNIMSSRFGFSIIHGTNKRDFYVSSESERNIWIEALRNAMKQYDIEELYQIQQLIGQGKFSIVHKAVRKETQQVVAIKMIDKSKTTEHERELLRSEIAILRLLHHPHVISLREVLDTQNAIYLVMELVAGGELYDLLQQKKQLPERQVNRIIYQLLSTVAYLHKCGIIHRDLKPENILLTDGTMDANIKITDFGLSCICGLNEVVTQPCGTLAYVAPEVLTLQGYNHKVDVWSVGVIMYLLLCGRLPFPIARPGTGITSFAEHRPLQFEGYIWDTVCSSAKDLLIKLLCPRPENRISAQEALQHIWLKNPTAVMIDDENDNKNFETKSLSPDVPSQIPSYLDCSSSTLSIVNVNNELSNKKKLSNLNCSA